MARRLTADLRIGQCACVLNPRTGRGVSVCKVPKSESRSGIKFSGKCSNHSKTRR